MRIIVKNIFSYLTVLFITLFLSIKPILGQSIDDDLLILYKLDGNAIDSSGNGFDGIVNATLAQDRNGTLNSCYYFNGTNSYIDFPNNAALKPQLPVSLSFWINFSSLSPGVLTTDFAQDIHTGVWVSLNSEHKIAFNFGDGGVAVASSRRTKIGETVLQVNKWYHVLGVVRGANDMDIYINGINDCGVYTGSGGALQYSGLPGSLGRKDSNASQPPHYFNGYLDEFYYWKREVGIEEIYSAAPVKANTDFIDFEVDGQLGPSIIDTVNHTIDVNIACNASLLASPLFTLSTGATAYVNYVEQVSGVSTNDFTNQIEYTIENGTSCNTISTNWVVIFHQTTASPEEAYISTSFESIQLQNQVENPIIDSLTNTIQFTVECSADLNSLALYFDLKDNGHFFQNNFEYTPGTVFDFTNPLVVMITNDSTCSDQRWMITVKKQVYSIDVLYTSSAFSSIHIQNQQGNSTVDSLTNSILFEVGCNADLNSLTLNFDLAVDSKLYADNVGYDSGETFNFSKPISVLIANGTNCAQQYWTISATKHQINFDDLIANNEYFIPNIITPNYDDKNDNFRISNLLIGSSVTIVNRHGIEVYHTDHYFNEFNGINLSSGTYYYVIENSCLSDPIKGSLTILK